VFTDLKMPGMDGGEVVKGVKHLRPDVDVAVITGYATIESAVATMQDGAADYVQKPFTAGELVAFAQRLLLQRQARLEAQQRPHVRIVAPGFAHTARADEFCVPGGAFLSDGHAWARLEGSGQVRIGLDDFARKALGTIERVDLPTRNGVVRRGDPLFVVHRGRTSIHVLAPLSGRMVEVNAGLAANPGWLAETPYDDGWVCLLDPSDIAGELGALRIGKPVVDWYQTEISRLRQVGGPAEQGAPQVNWNTLETEFFTTRAAA
jgi:glycine cleavage system H lipoate-binding protein